MTIKLILIELWQFELSHFWQYLCTIGSGVCNYNLVFAPDNNPIRLLEISNFQ